MNITKKDVEYAAALARLELSEEEKDKYAEQLNVILEYVNQLNDINTEGVEESSHSIPLTNVTREDVVGQSLDRVKVLKNAPEQDRGCFKVPKIIE